MFVMLLTWEHNTNTQKYHILEYIDVEGTRLSSEIYHQLEPTWPRISVVEHCTSIPKVAGSIPTLVRQTQRNITNYVIMF